MTLDEIRTFALTHQAEIEFTELAEAREYRETVKRLASIEAKKQVQDKFPETLIV